jgi:hypothetical protein
VKVQVELLLLPAPVHARPNANGGFENWASGRKRNSETYRRDWQ